MFRDIIYRNLNKSKLNAVNHSGQRSAVNGIETSQNSVVVLMF